MANPPEPPEKGTLHASDELVVDDGVAGDSNALSHAGHGHADDHGHAHGHAADLGYEIIPETSPADNFLIFLAVSVLIGLFAFAGIMITAPVHHADAHGSQHW